MKVTFPPDPVQKVIPPSLRASSSTNSDDDTSDQLDDLETGDDFEREMALSNAALRRTGSGNYRHLGSSRQGSRNGFANVLNAGNGQRDLFKALTPKRIAGIGAVVIFLIYLFGGSSGVPSKVLDKVKGGLSSDPSSSAGKVQGEDVPAAALPPSSPQKENSPADLGGPTKPGSCTPPPGKKAKSYALMIDAGSTGSRLHLYTFSHCDPSPNALPKLEDEGFYTTKPGLSSYAGNPTGAAESLRGLLEHADRGVPKEEQGCTPVSVKATAGLRLLGDRESTEILDAVEDWLRKEWRFSVVNEGVTIMDGKDEGVYAWITINYLLGLIGPSVKSSAGSAAVMDLGGASTQIVFEPAFDPAKSSETLQPGDHVYDLDFAGQAHVLYQHSHLGYGLMQARRAVHNLVGFQYIWSAAAAKLGLEWDELTTTNKIHNPCMFKGEEKVVALDPPGRKSVQVTMVGTGAGFEACRRVVDVMLAKDAKCYTPPCAFAGVYQPSLGEVFQAGRVWALSYFYDRIAPLGLVSPFRLSALRMLTSNVCAGKDSPTWSRFRGNAEAMEELSDRPEYCLDLTFMYTLLSLGYELDDEREIWIGKKVAGVELGWALGAAIAMIDGHLSCRPDVPFSA